MDGKKFIIELEQDQFVNGSGSALYRVKGFNSLVFDSEGIKKLKPYEEPDLNAIKSSAYRAGYDDACLGRKRYADDDDVIIIGDEVEVVGTNVNGFVYGFGVGVVFIYYHENGNLISLALEISNIRKTGRHSNYAAKFYKEVHTAYKDG